MRSEWLSPAARGQSASAQVLACAVLFAAACGTGSPTPEYDPPLLTLHGAITGQTRVSEASVALVWRRGTDGGLLPWSSTLPLHLVAGAATHFELEVTSVPPSEAMASLSPQVRAAVGTLLIYADDNGDHALDLYSADTKLSETTDRVLGALVGQSIVYVEAPDTRTPARGFHLYQPVAVNAVGQDWLGTTGAPSPQLLSASTELTVALSDEPQLPAPMCLGLTAGSAELPQGAPPCDGNCPSYDLAPGSVVSCAADGHSFTSSMCPAPGSLCAVNGCIYRSGIWPQGSPEPTGWPCQ
jgi:hypothetical protein